MDYCVALRKLPAYPDRLRHYLHERYAIYQRKQSRTRLADGTLTADPILRAFKFTNVRRAWDYTSTWLREHWYTKEHFEDPYIGLACCVARFINYVPSLDNIGFPTESIFWMGQCKRILHERAKRKEKVFTSAYMIAGGSCMGKDKIDWVFNDIIRPAWQSGALAPNIELTTCEARHAALRQCHGFGAFMTQEVVLDLCETHLLHTAPDRRYYGYPGPGALRGLNRVLNLPVRAHRSPTRTHEELLALYERMLLDHVMPETLHASWTVHDTEFNLCEFDKYERTLFGEGAPKQRYHPRTQLELL